MAVLGLGFVLELLSSEGHWSASSSQLASPGIFFLVRNHACATAMAACFDVDFGYMKRHAFWDEPLTDVTEQLFKV